MKEGQGTNATAAVVREKEQPFVVEELEEPRAGEGSCAWSART